MTSLSTPSFAPPLETDRFRTLVRPSDAPEVERLVRATAVFNEAEISIARELVEECLAKGEEASGYRFLFADGPLGIDGYCCYGPIPGTKGRYELYWIAVNPLARRLGLGRRLEEAVEESVRAIEGRYLIAETSTLPGYDPARAFYLARGFTQIAEVPDWHDEGDGLAIFGKRL